MKNSLGDEVARRGGKHSNKNDCPIEPATLKRGEVGKTIEAVRAYKGAPCLFSVCRQRKNKP